MTETSDEAHSNEARHAFLILAHEKPQQLAKLVDALQYPSFDVYLHVDVTAEEGFSEVSGACDLVSEYDISWGGFAMVEATLFLLRRARETADYHSYTLLSGADYPIKSNAYIDETLSSISATRIDYWHDEDPSWYRRYKRYFFHDWPYPVSRVLNGLSRRLARVLPDRSLPEEIVPYFGSQWWTLHQDGAEAVFEFINRRPDIVRFMRTVHIPDEMFFQTALLNAEREVSLVREPLRYFDWSAGRAHPKVLGEGDLQTLRQSDSLFACKFDERELPGIIRIVEEMRSNRPNHVTTE